MKSYSQAGQDDWVIETLKGKRDGTFLDVGCYMPMEINNTFKLEREFGWTGVGVDRAFRFKAEWENCDRKFHCADVLEIDWKGLCATYFHAPPIDYLSLDVDEHQLEVVRKFPWDKIHFNVMTIEHDSYRFGNEARDEIRSILKSHGYKMAVEDVAIAGVPFEDWWISESL
jgi:hypothetical protein